MRLFDFVEEHHRIGFLSDSLRQLTRTVLVTDISGRRADKLTNRIFFHKFRHIETDHKLFVAEQALGKCLSEIGFTDARRSYEDKRSYGTVDRFKSHAGTPYRFGYSGHRFVLSHDTSVQFFLQTKQAVALRFRETGNGNARARAHDISDFLSADR